MYNSYGTIATVEIVAVWRCLKYMYYTYCRWEIEVRHVKVQLSNYAPASSSVISYPTAKFYVLLEHRKANRSSVIRIMLICWSRRQV